MDRRFGGRQFIEFIGAGCQDRTDDLPLTKRYLRQFEVLQEIAKTSLSLSHFRLLKGYETACIGRPLSPGPANPVLAQAEQSHADHPVDAACRGQAHGAGNRPHRLLGSPSARFRDPRHGKWREELGGDVPGQRQDRFGDDRHVARIAKVGDARPAARASMEKAAAGNNPVVEKRVETVRAATNTVAAAVARYLDHCDRTLKPKTAKEWRPIFEHDVLPRWGERAV
jgi:hypothetical protein